MYMYVCIYETRQISITVQNSVAVFRVFNSVTSPLMCINVYVCFR